MAKNGKLTIKYTGGQLPENLGEILNNADEGDLRILAALLMAANTDGEIPESFSLCEVLGIEKAEEDASVKFWRGAGIIGGAVRKSTAQRPTKPVSEKGEAPKQEENGKVVSVSSAHKNGALESVDSVSEYRTRELADVFAQREELTFFVDEAQRVLGKTFNTYDTQIIVGIVDRLGMETQAVLYILAYARGIGKGTPRYCEKLAIKLYDEGYTTTEAVMQRIAQIESAKELESQIRKMFGMGSRALTKSEKTLFATWNDTYGFGIEIIKLAYDRTVDSIHEPAPKYLNAILEKWHANGLKTEQDILDFEASAKNGKTAKQGTASKSYEIDDFLDAAIKRSYDDLE